MTRISIWIGIGVFLIAMLATIQPSDRGIALSVLALGGSQAHAQHKGKGPYLPPILDTLEDLALDADDGGPDDDDDGPDDGGPDDDDDGPDDGPDDGKDDD